MRGTPLTQEKIDLILSLHERGVSNRKIAENVKCSRPTVANILKRNGITRDKPAEKPNQKPAAAPPPEKEKLTPREMIQRLYLLGYRIKDNKLVVVETREVDVEGIIGNK